MLSRSVGALGLLLVARLASAQVDPGEAGAWPSPTRVEASSAPVSRPGDPGRGGQSSPGPWTWGRAGTRPLPPPMSGGVSPFGKRLGPGGPGFEWAVHTVERPAVFRGLDTDHDGLVSPEQTKLPGPVIARALGRVPAALTQGDFTTVFASAYRDWCLFRYLGGSFDRPVPRAMLAALPVSLVGADVDRNGDGRISWDEWPPMVGRVILPGVAYASLAGFDPYDENLDGWIEGAEARSMLGPGGERYRLSYRAFLDVVEEELVHGQRFAFFLDADGEGSFALDLRRLLASSRPLDLDGDGALTLRDVLLARLRVTDAGAAPTPARTLGPSPGTPSPRPSVRVRPVTPAPPSVARPSALPALATPSALLPVPPAPSPAAPPRGVPDAGGSGPWALALGAVAVIVLGLSAVALERRRAGPAAGVPDRPASVDTDLITGKTYLKRGRFDLAAACFQKVMRRGGPDVARARALLVVSFLGLDQRNEALALLDALDLDPLEPDTLYELARTLEDRGLAERARAAYGRIYVRDVTFRDVARRLETLKGKLEAGAPGAQGPEAALKELGQRYSDLAPIGEGGQGLVYRAYDRTLHCGVALKLIQPSHLDDPDARKRFGREVRVLARLNHPCIVRVLDFRLEPYPYYSMPLLKGRPLGQLVADGLPALAERVRLAVQITAALQHAHERGVIHRDLKPENVFVTEEGQPCLIDFGLARSEELTRVTATGVVCGTLLYMAPEVLLGHGPTVASDIYGLGMVLYALLVGGYPFVTRGVTVDPDRRMRLPSEQRNELSPEFDRLLESCLDADPARRPGSCAELASRLRSLIDGPREAAPQGAAAVDNLVVAGRVEDLYRKWIHVLKNVFAVVARYADDADAASRRFFNDRVTGRILELTGPELRESLDDLGDLAPRAPLHLTPALKTAAGRIVEFGPRLLGLPDAIEDLRGRPATDQARALAGWHGSFVETGECIMEALRSLEVPIGPCLERAGRTVAGEVSLEADLGSVEPIRSGHPAALRTDLETALENLLQNALQAGARTVSVTGSLSANRTHLQLDLRNDGEEIPEPVAAKLFVAPVTTRPGGTGAGLVTSRHLLERHGGTVRLASRAPVVFRITVPRGRFDTGD